MRAKPRGMTQKERRVKAAKSPTCKRFHVSPHTSPPSPSIVPQTARPTRPASLRNTDRYRPSPAPVRSVVFAFICENPYRPASHLPLSREDILPQPIVRGRRKTAQTGTQPGAILTTTPWASIVMSSFGIATAGARVRGHADQAAVSASSVRRAKMAVPSGTQVATAPYRRMARTASIACVSRAQ